MSLDVATRELRRASLAVLLLEPDPIAVGPPPRTRARLAIVTRGGGEVFLHPAPIALLHSRRSAEERAPPEVRILDRREVVDCQAVNQGLGRMIHGLELAPIGVPAPLAQKSLASRLKPKVVFSATGGSIRPPPVKRSPPAQNPVPSENEGLGPAGIAGRSQPDASSVATTRPGTNPSLICLHMLCLLSRVVSRTAAGGAVAIQMPVGGLQVLLVKSRVTRAVAVAQRAAGASLAR